MSRRSRRAVVLALAAAAASGCAAAAPEDAVRRGRGSHALSECGGVGTVGCCAGETLYYCGPAGDGGSALVVEPCGSHGCGWNPVFSLYMCGGSVPEDPSATHPRQCPGGVLDDAGADASAGDAPTADAAVGDAAEGDAGDGGGDAADGSPADGGACQGVEYVGCCAGEQLRFCVAGQLMLLDCSGDPACGWNAVGGYYSCGTDGEADPAGVHAKSCPSSTDGAVSPDGQGDAVNDAPSADLADALVLDGSDGPVADGGGGHDDAAAGDVAAGDRVGLEPVGLEVVGLDAAVIDGGGGGDDGQGCSCRTTEEGAGSPLLLLGALLALRAASRRRRWQAVARHPAPSPSSSPSPTPKGDGYDPGTSTGC